MNGYDVVTDYKIKMYEGKEKKLEQKQLELLNKIKGFINQIKNPYIKSIFEYRYIADMKFEEIADRIGKDEDAIKKAYHRFLKKLRSVPKCP